MIVLDTNVISELMRPAPSPGVVSWVASRPRHSLCATSVTQAELLSGVALLPKGQRRDRIAATVSALFELDFAGKILPFDERAAPLFTEIVAKRRANGKPIDGFDALITARARANDAAIATRDVDGFEDCGVTIIDPWTVA